MDFEIDPAHAEVVRVARKVASRFADSAIERDVSGQFPASMLREIAAAGLLGLDVPESAGGQGAGSVAAGLVAEELAAADYTAGAFIVQASSGARLLMDFAPPEVARRWLPRLLAGDTTLALALTEGHSGSDLADLRVRARRSGTGWRITGEKTSVSYPQSDAIAVLARSDDGPVLLLVEQTETIVSHPLDDVGARALGRSTMIFDDVPADAITVLAEGRESLKAVFGALVTARLIVCMTALGVGRAAFEDACAWMKERHTFGAPLSHRQGVAFPAVDAATDLELGRLITLKGLWLADQGLPHDREAAMAKAWIPPRMFEICHWALQVQGHPAYTRGHKAQQRLRDVLATELGEGATNIQRLLLARQLLGVRPG
jgi:cyclohexanecarboxyl-CoA dehydrogenase